MSPVRRSTRKRVPPGSRQAQAPKAQTPTAPCPQNLRDEKPQKWQSPLKDSEQLAVHGYLLSATKAAKIKPARRPVVPARRQSSEETLAAYSSDRTIQAQSSRDTSRTLSESPNDLKNEEEAALAVCMLNHAPTAQMSISDLYTPFVQAHMDTVELVNFGIHGEVQGHFMPVQKWNEDNGAAEKDNVKVEWDMFVKESEVRESIKKEAEYKLEIEREGETRKRMRKMLEAFAGKMCRGGKARR